MPRTSSTAPARRSTSGGGDVDQTTLLLRMVEQLRNDYARDQEDAKQSRAALRGRVDELFDRLARMETSTALEGQIDAQVRTEIDTLNQRLGDGGDVGDTVAAWRDLLRTGRRVTLLASIAGITSLSALVALLTGAWDWLKSALRIG